MIRIHPAPIRRIHRSKKFFSRIGARQDSQKFVEGAASTLICSRKFISSFPSLVHSGWVEHQAPLRTQCFRVHSLMPASHERGELIKFTQDKLVAIKVVGKCTILNRLSSVANPHLTNLRRDRHSAAARALNTINEALEACAFLSTLHSPARARSELHLLNMRNSEVTAGGGGARARRRGAFRIRVRACRSRFQTGARPAGRTFQGRRLRRGRATWPA